MTDRFERMWKILQRPAALALVNATFVPTNGELVRSLARPTLANAMKAQLFATLMDASSALRIRLLSIVGIDPASLIGNRSALEDFVYQYTGSMFHPVGTCKIGKEDDPEAVVDPRCRVIGLEGLRVADGSVMPAIVRGNTNIPIIMIAEKVSSMIAEDDAARRH